MGKRLKAAVIGCGGAGVTNHIPWYAENPEVELVGVVDAKASAAQHCVRKYGVRAYNSLAEMLDKEEPDMVSVATPGHLHREHTITCLNHNCHVLCEKPMAPTLEECQEMIDAAGENDRILGIVSDRRFDVGYEKAREIIVSGAIGKPLFIRVHWIANCVGAWSKGYRVRLETGGGTFQDCGAHYIDICRWWLGSEIETVEGMIDICYPEVLEVEDQAVALLRFKNGVSGMIETSWVGPKGYRANGIHQEIHDNWIYGTEGTIRVLGNREPAGIDLWDKKTGEWRMIPVPCVVQFSRYRKMIDEFVACVQKGEAFPPSGEDGKKVMEVVLGLYQASSLEKKVSLPLGESPDITKIFTELREKSLQRGK